MRAAMVFLLPNKTNGGAVLTGTTRDCRAVRLVWGLADDIFTATWGMEWQARIPHATWDGLDGAAHFLQDTHGEQVAAAVLRRSVQN